MVLDAVTFLISFALIAFGVKTSAGKGDARDTIPLWQSLKWVTGQPVVIKLGVYDLVVNSVATPLLALTLPVIAKNLGDASVWLGIWLACFAAGTTLTTALYTFLGARVSSLALLRYTPIGQALGLLILLLAIWQQWALWWLGLGLFFYGMNLGVGSMLDAMVLQIKVPVERRGAVFSLFASFRYVGVPFGLLFAGLLLDQDLGIPLLAMMALILILPSAIWLNTRHEDVQH